LKMGSLSFALVALIFAHLSACLPQVVTPIAITNSAPLPTVTCGGCYVVADVAGIEFGTETVTHLQSATVSIGLNQTTVISVQTQVGVTEFSFAPSGILGTVTGTLFNYGTAITVSGVTLTSPTAYDVFTAYSITSTVFSNGGCSTIFGSPITLSSAFSFARSPGVAGIDQSAEQSFIEQLGGLPSCSPGGVNISPTTAVPVVVTTAFSTITRTLPTPQPLMSATSSTPTSTRTSTTTVTSSSLSSSVATTTLTSTISVVAIIPVPSNSTTLTSTISVGTIIIAGNSTFLPTGYGPTFTIIPVTGQAADWRMNSTISWLAWATGVLSTLVAMWVF